MKIKNLFCFAAAGAMLVSLPACLNDDDSPEMNRPTAVVTVCPSEDGGFVMQLDDETRLIPANMNTSPFGPKEVRALVNYTEAKEAAPDNKLRNVEVNWIDSIRTKLPVETLGDRDAEVYGHDPVEIIRDWVTVAEDGYLTLRLRTVWGPGRGTHVISLVTGTNPDDPYELVLRHDAKGENYGTWGDALIAFNLNGLVKNGAEATKFKLRWESFTGEKTIGFELKKNSRTPNVSAADIRYSGNVK